MGTEANKKQVTEVVKNHRAKSRSGGKDPVFDLADAPTYDEIMRDYGNPIGAAAAEPEAHALRAAALAAYLNSHETTFFWDAKLDEPEEKKKDSASWEAKGNMSEAAIVVGAAKARFAPEDTECRSITRLEALDVP